MTDINWVCGICGKLIDKDHNECVVSISMLDNSLSAHHVACYQKNNYVPEEHRVDDKKEDGK